MSGRHVMMGYMGSEERTAETLEDSEEGWLRYERNRNLLVYVISDYIRITSLFICV